MILFQCVFFIHISYLAIDGELFDRSESLWGDAQDLEVVDLGQHEIQVITGCEVTWILWFDFR